MQQPHTDAGPGGGGERVGGSEALAEGEGRPLLSSSLHTSPVCGSALGAAISIDQNWLEMQIKKEITTM